MWGGGTFTLIREGTLTLFYIGGLQMFNRYEDAMKTSKDEEIIEDG